jgi:hypothetical protein
MVNEIKGEGEGDRNQIGGPSLIIIMKGGRYEPFMLLTALN